MKQNFIFNVYEKCRRSSPALNLFNNNPFIDLPDSLLAYMNDLLVVQSPGIGAFLSEHSLNYVRIPRVQPVLNPNVPWLDLML